jgi:Glucodextranase, domain N
VAEPGEVSAPGWPGSPPRWTSSAKSGLGTALTASSRVWVHTEPTASSMKSITPVSIAGRARTFS